MKIISYLLNKLNGFRIGIDEDGNAQLISYRNHPFTNTGGGGAKRVEAFINLTEESQLQIAQSKYDELNTGDVLVANVNGTEIVNEIVELAVIAYSLPEDSKLVFNIGGEGFTALVPTVPYPVTCLLYKDGEHYEAEFVEDNNTYSAFIYSAFGDPFTVAYDILFLLDATLVKLEHCDGSFEPTEVVSGATLATKTIDFGGGEFVTVPCLSFSDNFTPAISTYRYKATTSDGEIKFSISYQGMA